MALQKQSVPINFNQGLDTKTDSKQVQVGKFLNLKNSVFDTLGQLTKRNGFASKTVLPNANQTILTTLNGNLLATGSNLYAYGAGTNAWTNQGTIQPVSLSVEPLVHNSANQSAPDSVTTTNGLTCLVYVDSVAGACYQISDSNTGQQIVARTVLPNAAVNPRVFLMQRYFIVSFVATISGTPHLQYIAIPLSSVSTPLAAADISTTVNTANAAYDGIAYQPTNTADMLLYFTWAATSTTIQTTYLTPGLGLASPVTLATAAASLISISADSSNDFIWISYYSGGNGYTTYYDYLLFSAITPVQIITATTINQLATIATGVMGASVINVFYQVQNTYSFTPNTRTDYITAKTATQAGVVSAGTIILRSVGLASKPFIADNGNIYMLAAYGESNQPTYFLIDSTGNIYMRLAYSNGGGYTTAKVLPQVSIIDGEYLVAYRIKDFLTTVNKTTASGLPTNAIYSQTGINLAKFSINVSGQYSSEIANTLHLTGGQLWMYDSVRPVEHGFHVWPENNTVTTSATGGLIAASTYNYVFVYEWTDNQGNLHRSAPSIPVAITTTGSTSTNTLNVPTLRLTYKIAPNPVRIVGYRWSTAQQTYYQFTSVTSPTLNSTTVDSVTMTDTLADSAILGNAILYTTGSVVENIAAPASIASALFKNRLFLVDAEDPNLIWFSKQVIQAVPVEMSDLLTIYVAPTSGAQGSTGPIRSLSAMDDKLIIFKSDAIYYITGVGPDNTGANNDFSDPVFITSSVGCSNPNSIVLMPNGIMFQSDKGIWLLGRDLSTTYIGADVEAYNNFNVQSAKAIPGANQVRFVLTNNVTLMYDYYRQQWGTFSNLQAISSTLYESKDTYLNAFGQVFQETPNTYVDGSSPVLMSFTTSWINVAGLQGYERFYSMDLLGTYYTPFKLNVQLAYNYNPSPLQSTPVTPDNYSPAWGGDAQWGSADLWGGPGNVFEAKVSPEIQKCESFQVTINEIFDSSYGANSGKGLTLSGLNLMIGLKKSSRTTKASQSFG